MDHRVYLLPMLADPADQLLPEGHCTLGRTALLGETCHRLQRRVASGIHLIEGLQRKHASPSSWARDPAGRHRKPVSSMLLSCALEAKRLYGYQVVDSGHLGGPVYTLHQAAENTPRAKLHEAGYP